MAYLNCYQNDSGTLPKHNKIHAKNKKYKYPVALSFLEWYSLKEIERLKNIISVPKIDKELWFAAF